MDNINMNTIKTHPSDRNKVTITKSLNFEKIGEVIIEKRTYKGYTIGNIPNDFTHWFNYKGLTYIIN